MQKIVFISNAEITANNISNYQIGASLIPAMGLSSFLGKVDRSGETLYAVDVHCVFPYGVSESEGQYKLQEQSGVIIYRNLLNKFNGCQDKLKIIFYSPFPKSDLVRLRPENYVLQLLPFVECKYEHGQFEADLTKEIEKYEREGWPQFNNASENLLSGWAKVNEKVIKTQHNPVRIKTGGKLIQFIDDQQSEWKLAFDTIFEENCVVYCKYAGQHIRSQHNFKTEIKENWGRFKKAINDKASNHEFDIILSDFYIKENHEVTEWKSRYKLSKISGYEIFQEVRSKIPATPYIFHTSSNKATTYKFFDSKGIDEWIVKDGEPDSPHKTEYFTYFKSVVEDCAFNPLYGLLSKLWESIEKIEVGTNYWWLSHLSTKSISQPDVLEIKAEYVSILKNSWLAIRHLINKETEFEEDVSELPGQHQFDQNNFYATAIIGNLYKIIESLNTYEIPQAFLSCTPLKLIDAIRNSAIHNNNKDNKYLNIDDCTIFIQLLTDFLMYCGDGKDVNGNFPQFQIFQKSSDVKFQKLNRRMIFDKKVTDNDEKKKILLQITDIIANPATLPCQYQDELGPILNYEPSSSNKTLRFALLWAYLPALKKSKKFKQDNEKNNYWNDYIALFEKRIESILNAIKIDNELIDFCKMAEILFKEVIVIKEEGKLVDFKTNVIVNRFG